VETFREYYVLERREAPEHCLIELRLAPSESVFDQVTAFLHRLDAAGLRVGDVVAIKGRRYCGVLDVDAIEPVR
jgi:hypothetical protein